mgnify:CR=1 FL=1
MIKNFLSHLSLLILSMVAWHSIVYGVALGAYWVLGWSVTITAIKVAMLLFIVMLFVDIVLIYRENRARAKRIAALKARLDSVSAKRLAER